MDEFMRRVGEVYEVTFFPFLLFLTLSSPFAPSLPILFSSFPFPHCYFLLFSISPFRCLDIFFIIYFVFSSLIIPRHVILLCLVRLPSLYCWYQKSARCTPYAPYILHLVPFEKCLTCDVWCVVLCLLRCVLCVLLGCGVHCITEQICRPVAGRAGHA